MSTLKRCISLLLVLGILLSVLAPATQAAPVEETATVNTGNVTIEGTNGFGELLSREITASQAEAAEAAKNYPAGYSVTDLVIEGRTSTVTYDSMEEATLVVALYTEDGMQLLTSATATVTPNATEAALTFEGEMPKYFMASAYLVDSYDLSPLCPAYETPMYTQDMQELLASTIHDYDPERVLNLDENETTNFAVYADSTILIEPVEGKNIVAYIDAENYTYVIENADEQFTSLVEGNVFVYPYTEDDTLIARVSLISINGDTVTIGIAEVTTSEIFKVIKIDTSEVAEPNSKNDKTVSYERNSEEYYTFGSLIPERHNIVIPPEKDKTFTISGSVNYAITVEYKNFLCENNELKRLHTYGDLQAELTIEGEKATKEISLGEFRVVPFAGIGFAFEPTLTVAFNGSATFKFSISLDAGFEQVENAESTYRLINKAPKPEFMIEDASCSISITFDPNLQVEFLIDEFSDVVVSLPINLALTIKNNGSSSDMTHYHTCNKCFILTLSSSFGITLKIESVVIPDKFIPDWEIFEDSTDLGLAYYSVDLKEFDFGQCPGMIVGLAVSVRNVNYQPICGAEVTVKEFASNDVTTMETNEKGVAAFNLSPGQYIVKVNYTDSDGKEKTEYNFENIKKHRNLYFTFGELGYYWDQFKEYIGIIDEDDFFMDKKVVQYGGHSYVLFDSKNEIGKQKKLSWDEAGKLAQKLGGHLATITSKDENKFLYDYMSKTCDYENAYFGLSDAQAEDKWKWCTEESLDEVFDEELAKELWADGEPNGGRGENYGMYYYKSEPGKWNDGSNNSSNDFFVYLFEWENLEKFERYGMSSQCADDFADVTEGTSQDISVQAIYSGEYGSKNENGKNLKTACFSELIPGEQYVIWALADIDVKDPLDSDNLLFVDQAVAQEDGTLAFEYIQQIPSDVSYVFVCGASNKNLKDAQITFPEMVADGELQVIEPIVVYDGITLTEGMDYEVSGEGFFTESGEYTCTISGIHNYTGEVECTYTVTGHEHSFSNYTSDGNATCSKDGTKTAKCDSCNQTKTIRDEGSILGHDFGDWNTVRSANCTEDGEEQRSCARCDHIESKTIEAVGHGWDDGIVTKEPTEETEGERLYICIVCGATKIVSIPAIGHEHSYEAAVTAPTCTEQGYTTYTCRCGDSYPADYVEALGHAFREWIVIQKPTIREDGIEEHTCTRCGHSESRSIAKLPNPFTDVPKDSFFYVPVMWALENEVTAGATETTFNPSGLCLRAHVVTFLYRAAGSPVPSSTKTPFTDVKSCDFYYNPVLWAVENGITQGISKTQFGSTQVCNRAAVVTFLWRAFGSPEPKSTYNPFVDVKNTDFFYNPVLWAVENGITAGVDATHFNPAGDCNRAQVVTFLYRAYN